MDKGSPSIVAQTWTDSEASVIKSLLESYNIPSSKLPHNTYPLSVDGLGEIRIYVPASLADEARRILQDHRRSNFRLRLVEDQPLEEEKA